MQTVFPLKSRRTSSSSVATIKPQNSYETDFPTPDELAKIGAEFDDSQQHLKRLNDAKQTLDRDILSDIHSHSDVFPVLQEFSNIRRQIEVFLEYGYGNPEYDNLDEDDKLDEFDGLIEHAERYNAAIDRVFEVDVAKRLPLPQDIAKIVIPTFQQAVHLAQHVKQANEQIQNEAPWRESLEPGLKKEIEEFIAKSWLLTAAFMITNAKRDVLRGMGWFYSEDHEKFGTFWERRMTSMRDILHKAEAKSFAVYIARDRKLRTLVDGYGMDAVCMVVRDEE